MPLFEAKDQAKLTLSPGDVQLAPNSPAVFVIWPAAQNAQPYLARTNVLRRRLIRLLGERSAPSRFLSLRGVAGRIDYWLTGSNFESNLLYYSTARELFPDSYLQTVKLRFPSYLKLNLANEFPRTSVTTKVTGSGKAIYLGPFRSRTAAGAFDSQFLDLFQIRRCEENLAPNPDHPGCIYGEMNMCLRPCQAIVSAEQYAAEVHRVEQFLTTGGKSLLDPVAAARERLSEEMNFEEAARQHQRHQKIEKILSLRDDLVRDLEHSHGIAVTAAVAQGAVNLWFFRAGWWHGPVLFELPPPGVEILPMDRRLREIIEALPPRDGKTSERQEHCALLARWYYSTWRQGEWLPFESWTQVPYRKLVNAISRVSQGVKPTA